MTLTKEQRIANLAKGRETARRNRERKKREAEEKLASVAAKPRNGAGEPEPPAPPPEPEPASPPPSPAIAEVAERTQIFTSADPIPPPENDPQLARGMTVETIDFADDGAPPTSLDGIFETFPIDGSGDYYVTVDRKTPRHYGGTSIAGMLQRITGHMTREQFADAYGGGEYMLVVHGPAVRGRLIDPSTGMPRRKSLTKQIKITIPLNDNPPNLNATMLPDELEEEDETVMYQPGYRPRTNGRSVSNADAEIHRANLTHEEKMREREDKVRREAQAGLPDMGAVLAAQAETQRDVEIERERSRREDARMRQEREQRLEEQIAQARAGGDTPAMMEAMGNIIASLKAGGDSGAADALRQAQDELTRLSTRHSDEINRINEKHNTEVQRLTDKHQSELNQLRADHDRSRDRDERAHKDEVTRIQAAVGEAEERSRKATAEAEQRAERRVTEIEEASRRALAELKAAEERRFSDMKTALEQRLADEKERQEREIKTNDRLAAQRLDAQKDMFENRINAMASELTREREETTRAKAEAEGNKDIVGKITELKATASALGMRDDGEPAEEMPSDFKGMLAWVFRDLIKSAPDLISSATEGVRQLRGQPSQMAAMQQMGGMPAAHQLAPAPVAPPLIGRDGQPWQPSQPMAFGTEDGPDFVGDEGAYVEPKPEPPPTVPGQIHAPIAPQPAPQPPPPPPQAAPPAPMAATMQPQAAAPPPQPQPMHPPQAMPTTAQQAAAPPPQQAVIPDEMIVQFSPALRAAFESDIPPEEAAGDIIGQVGAQQAAVIAAGLSAERIVAVLQRQPGAINNPLLMRDGQQYLRELIDSVAEQAAQG